MQLDPNKHNPKTFNVEVKVNGSKQKCQISQPGGTPNE